MSKYKNPESCINNLISQINYVLGFKNVDRINAYIKKINNLQPVNLYNPQPQSDIEISALQRLHVQCYDNYDFKNSSVLKLIIAIAQTKIKALEAQQTATEKDKYKAEKENYKSKYNTCKTSLSTQKSAPQIQPQPENCDMEKSNYGALKNDYDTLKQKYDNLLKTKNDEIKNLTTELNLYKTDVKTIKNNIALLKKSTNPTIQGDIDIICSDDSAKDKQNGGYKNKSKRRTRRRRVKK